MSDNIILSLNDVKKSYKMGSSTLQILKGVNFSLSSGEWCCVYGASGSGKTTLLNLIGGLEKPDSGIISVCGTDIGNLSRTQAARFRAKKIGFVFQSYHLLPELTILENVALAGAISGMPMSKAKMRAGELLEIVGLKNRIHHRPSELSGGEQQRSAIARALINSPELLLADEPTGNLDPDTGDEILNLFKTLQQENSNQTILMITHNRDIAALATRSVDLKEGLLLS